MVPKASVRIKLLPMLLASMAVKFGVEGVLYGNSTFIMPGPDFKPDVATTRETFITIPGHFPAHAFANLCYLSISCRQMDLAPWNTGRESGLRDVEV